MRLVEFVQLSPVDRKPYFDELAAQRGMSLLIVEKDFWVCWLLKLLFESELGEDLVFKGGTSLSKVYGAIERFSEDLDLTLSPAYLGFEELELTADLSGSRAKRWSAEVQAACQTAVEGRIREALEHVVGAALPARRDPWLSYAFDEAAQSAVLWFSYPAVAPYSDQEYIAPQVKLEFGSRTDQRPRSTHGVTPWLVESFPQAIVDWQCEVVALDFGRTFWEKATILHLEYHRPAARALTQRTSRHYADLAALAAHELAEQALADSKLRQRVVDWKKAFFRSGWAKYEEAQPPTFRLVPQERQLAALRRDYDSMRTMFYDQPMSIDRVLQVLSDLEARINEQR